MTDIIETDEMTRLRAEVQALRAALLDALQRLTRTG
jgi:hypothetical protein